MDCETAISFQYKLWYLIGLSTDNNCIYKMYSFANYLFSILHVLCCSARLLKSKGATEICFSMFFAILLSLLLFKFINLRTVLNNLRSWRRTTHELDKNFKSEAEKTVFNQSICLVRKIFFLFVFGASGSILCLELLVIISAFNGNRVHIVPILTPFDEANNVIFWLINVIHLVICLYRGFREVASDFFGIICMSVFAAYINTLSHRVRLIGHKEKSPKDTQELLDCIQNHQLILK